MKRIITFLAVLILFGTSGILRAQNVGGQKSKFIRPIGIMPVQDAYGATLNFGVIVPNKTQGGVLYVPRDGSWLTPGAPGVISGAATVLNYNDVHPKAHAADWKVTGEPNYLYQVTTSNPTTLSLSDGSQTMVMTWAPAYVFVGGTGDGVNVFGKNQDPGAGAHQYTQWVSILDASGNGGFSQGATISVNANQQPGLYTGTWSETVQYQ